MRISRLLAVTVLAASLVFSGIAFGQVNSGFSPLVQKSIAVDSPVVALEHVNVVDGTGAARFFGRV